MSNLDESLLRRRLFEYGAIPAQIVMAVSKATDTSLTEIFGKRRYTDLAYIRQIAMYLVRQNSTLSYPEMGQMFNRDHSTVVHAVRSIEERLELEDITTKALITASFNELPKGVRKILNA